MTFSNALFCVGSCRFEWLGGTFEYNINFVAPDYFYTVNNLSAGLTYSVKRGVLSDRMNWTYYI